MTPPTYPTFAGALDAARAQVALAGGGDVVVHDRDGRPVWREYVDARGRAHPVAIPTPHLEILPCA